MHNLYNYKKTDITPRNILRTRVLFLFFRECKKIFLPKVRIKLPSHIISYYFCEQAKVIKTAAFCHNRALQDLYPDSYRLLFTTGSFTLTASPLSNEPDVQRVQRSNMLEG